MNCDQEFNWKKLMRNVLIDLQKGLHVLKKKTTKMFRLKYKVSHLKRFLSYLSHSELIKNITRKMIKINYNCP